MLSWRKLAPSLAFAACATALAAAEVPVGTAPTVPEKTFGPQALREDLSILRKALEQAHPGLTRYATAQEIRLAFDQADAALQSPKTESQFFQVIAPLLAVVRDDHTYVLPSAEFWRQRLGPTGYTQTGRTGDLRLFPFFVTLQAGHLYITHNNSSNPAISRGTEILSINGQPASAVVATLERAMPTSGLSDVHRRRQLEQFSPQQEYNLFCLYYALMIGTPENFILQLRAPRATAGETVTVPALRSPELWDNFRARYVGTNDALLARNKPLQLAFPDSNTAVLSLSSFHDWRWNRDKLDYRKDIAQTFRTLADRKINNLVIDLRGNEGGNAGIGIEVLGYLAQRPFQVYDYKEMMGYRFPDLLPHVRNPKDLDHFTPDLFERTSDGRFRIITSLPDETWSRPLAASSPAFPGRVWVLTDGATGSAAAQLATLIRVNRPDAVFVGEESGGDMEGPISGSYLELTLPNSGLRIDVPVLKKVMHLNGYAYVRGRGVQPNYAVVPSQEDIALGRDPALALALQQAAQPK